jgi:septum formation protein
LLEFCGISFTVLPAAVDESPLPDELSADYVRRVVHDKAVAVHAQHPGAFVLGADTAVIVDGRILGKPTDAAQARSMLQDLSGRVHEVYSAVALISPDGRRRERLSITEVEFAVLPESWIESYISSGDCMDKAGAYGIQNEAGLWICRLSGSYTGVVGLPLFETNDLLREAGLMAV